MGQLAYYHSFMGRAPDITERLGGTTGGAVARALGHVFFATSGSEAVESAAKIARYYQAARGKSGKTSLHRAGGGLSRLGSGQCGADRAWAIVMMASACRCRMSCAPGGRITSATRSLAKARSLFQPPRARTRRADPRADPGTIAAFIGEPAMGAGGVILPPEGYWAEVQEVLAGTTSC
jgi:4-aminobutyrate--pyruvate transaminase